MSLSLSTTLQTETPFCIHCEKSEEQVETLMVCGGCRKVRYCGRTCQKEHWKVHKQVCTFTKENKSLEKSGDPWKIVESYKDSYHTIAEKNPMLMKVLNREHSQELRKPMQFVYDYFLTNSEKRFVAEDTLILDLGCGNGSDTIEWLLLGAKVIAFDKDNELLNIYKKALDSYTRVRKNLPVNLKSNLILRNEDIVTASFTKKPGVIDIVYCINTLPFIPSNKLKSTLEKIHKCLKRNGLFFGTFYFRNKKIDADSSRFINLVEQLGARHYQGKNLAKSLLTTIGFNVVQYSTSKITACKIDLIAQFVAQKK